MNFNKAPGGGENTLSSLEQQEIRLRNLRFCLDEIRSDVKTLEGVISKIGNESKTQTPGDTTFDGTENDLAQINDESIQRIMVWLERFKTARNNPGVDRDLNAAIASFWASEPK